jgi:hypothetical protein
VGKIKLMNTKKFHTDFLDDLTYTFKPINSNGYLYGLVYELVYNQKCNKRRRSIDYFKVFSETSIEDPLKVTYWGFYYYLHPGQERYDENDGFVDCKKVKSPIPESSP